MYFHKKQQDYREEEIGYLRSSGKTDEEIYQIVPKTLDEQRQEKKKKLSEYDQLKEDVEMLKKELALLKASAEDSKEKNESKEKKTLDETDNTLEKQNVCI